MNMIALYTARDTARQAFDTAARNASSDARILTDVASRPGGIRGLYDPDAADIQEGPFGIEALIPAAGLASGATIDLGNSDPATRTGPITPNFFGGNDLPAAATRPEQIAFFTGVMVEFDNTAALTGAQFENLVSGLSLRTAIKLGDKTASDTLDFAGGVGTISTFTSLDGNAAPAVAFTRRARYMQFKKTVPVWLGSAVNNLLAIQANLGGVAALPAGGVRVRLSFTGFLVAASKNPTDLQNLYLGAGGTGEQRKRLTAMIEAARRLNAIEAAINGGRV